MRAVLLAAGLGTRLRPITNTIPKCMVPVLGKPLLDYWFEHLFSAGIARVLVNTHWLSDLVHAHVAQSQYRERVDLVHEHALLGTAGTILANRDWLGSAPFLVAHADNLTDFDVAELVAAHHSRPSECSMTMLAFRTDSPASCGILELDFRNVVQASHEKVANPPGNLANAAVYICEPDVVERIEALQCATADLSLDIIPQLVGRIYTLETKGYHRDVGSLESLSLAEAEYGVRTIATRQNISENS